MIRRPARVLLAAALAAAFAQWPVPAAAQPSIAAEPVASGLDQPVAFTFDPDGRLWYVERATGEIRILDLDTGGDRLFSTVDRVDASGEGGLLGIALHPDYPAEPFVYVYATRVAGGTLRNQILRIRDRGGSGGSGRVLFSSIAGTSRYHHGGRIAFGPDGKLYVTVGDAHDASNAQDLSDEDRGKILRLLPSGGVPRTNPFDDRVWSFGMRNSFGFAFDPRTGRLWETENGPECNDEINVIRRGRNYGWGPSASCEGTAPGDTNADGPDPVLPRLVFETPIGITGIAFCDRCHLGRRNEGAAFFGAVNDGAIRRIVLNRARTRVRRSTIVYQHGSGTIAFEAGPGGRIYFSDFDGIYELVRS